MKNIMLGVRRLSDNVVDSTPTKSSHQSTQEYSRKANPQSTGSGSTATRIPDEQRNASSTVPKGKEGLSSSMLGLNISEITSHSNNGNNPTTSVSPNSVSSTNNNSTVRRLLKTKPQQQIRMNHDLGRVHHSIPLHEQIFAMNNSDAPSQLNSALKEAEEKSSKKSGNNKQTSAGYHRLKSLFEKQSSTPSQDSAIQMLTQYPLLEEYDAIQLEIRKTNEEIKAMEDDYDRIITYLQNGSTLQKYPAKAHKNTTLLSNLLSDDYYSGFNFSETTLDHKTKSKIRKSRGLHFRVKIGGDNASASPNNSQINESRLSKVAFLSRCGSASRARTVTHVSLTGQAGFFIRRENGKWYVHGNLPKNLQNRLDREESAGNELRYLSIGPAASQCYYAEWSSGDCWWVNFDKEFHEIVNEFPVHRIAFGSSTSNKPSWIVLGKDGRSAWRGIPSRLANTLKNRDPSLPAPCEVSLGPGGSYFIKFLDGETDYILPAVVANECEDVEKNGGRVTNVSLHIDCYDFVIRHTETSKVKRGEVVIRKGKK